MTRSRPRHADSPSARAQASIAFDARVARLVVLAAFVSQAAVPSNSARAQSKLPATSGEVYLTIGEYRKALDAFESQRANDPTSSVALLGIGRAQEKLGRWSDAARAYTVYTQREPNDGAGFEMLGRSLGALGRNEDALRAFRTAQHLDPASSGAQAGAGRALHALGRNEEALRSLRIAARVEPDDATILGQLAVVSLSLGRTIEAASYWEEALRKDVAYFDARANERRDWERVTGELGTTPPRTSIAVSSEVATGDDPSDSTARTVAATDSTPRGVSAPYQPRFARASGSSAFLPGPSSSGTGFVVSRDQGYVLTNKHVVRACGQVKVRIDGGKTRIATLQAVDADDDLALLRVPLPAGPTATFRQDPAVRPGDAIVAVGFPLAGLLADQVNVSTGSVNALAGLYNDLHMLQMSAPVQPGSSGGALFDASGNVVGVVVTKLNAKVVAEETGDIPQNVNFAVKASVAREFLRDHGVSFRTAPSSVARSNADVGEIGRQVTILVECWP
jgi:S1-C subfamily serine protease